MTQDYQMYICICHYVTEQDIDDAFADGVRTMQQLEDQLDVTSYCGMCRNDVHSYIKKLEFRSKARADAA